MIIMPRQSHKITRFLFLFLFLLLPSLITAQMQEYEDYTVKKGDTLWDIASKELKDSFLWPKVWKENPGIKNPDLIYPGQKIRIPLYLLQKEITPVPEARLPEKAPEIKPEAKPEIKPEIKVETPPERVVSPVQREYLVKQPVLASSGYIADSVYYAGEITDTENDRVIIGRGDYAYVKMSNPVNKGDKFYVVKVEEKVIHPVTGKKLGYLIAVLGVAEVADPDRNDTKIVVTDSYEEISPGNLLLNFYEIKPPLAPENPRRPDVHGYVVATKHLYVINGTWDIVYIDRGRKDGLNVGDILATTLQSRHRIMNGEIQIISLGESTATAIIRKTRIEITKGDGVTAARS
jgi:LysM repeat protein